ncbi:MAG: hypothetical protein WCD45_02205 [Gallionella sp.]
MKKTILGIAILLPLVTVACHATPAMDLTAAHPAPHTNLPQPDLRRGGYLITTTANADESNIRKRYADYGVLVLRALGNHQYELRLQNDPGLEIMLHTAAQSNGEITAIQPNYSYPLN